MENNNKLLAYYNNPLFSDAILNNNKTNKTYNIHKVILASSSNYIVKLLNEFKLKETNKIKNSEDIEIDNIPFPPLVKPIIINNNDENSAQYIEDNEDIINILLKYCYSNQDFLNIQENINAKNIYSLLRYSCAFDIQSLTSSLCIYITDNRVLKPENASTSLIQALMLENVILQSNCLKLILENYNLIVDNKEEYNSLLMLPINVFKNIISSDDLVVDNELKVYNLVIDYIKLRKDKDFNDQELIKSKEDIQPTLINVEENKEVDTKPENNENNNNDIIKTNNENNNEQNQENVDKEENIQNNESNKLKSNKSIKGTIDIKYDTISDMEKKVLDIENSLKLYKLNNEQIRELILCIRFSYLSHKELISLNSVEEMNNHKDLILEGISLRLNPYEFNDQNNYKVNISSRKCFNEVNVLKNNNQKDINKNNNTNSKNINNINDNELKSYNDNEINKNNTSIKFKSDSEKNDNAYDNQMYKSINSNSNFNNLSNNNKNNYNSLKYSQNLYESDANYNKTSNYSNKNKLSFVYDYDFDENGAFYYLGTLGLISTFKNPHDLNIIKVFSSTLGKGKLSDLVNRELVNLRTLNEPNSFFGVDLGEDKYIVPSCYSIMNRASSSHVMLNWQLEASNDRINYEILDTRVFLTNDINTNKELEKEREMLKEPGCTSTWGIDPGFKDKFPKGFRYFLIKHIGRNSSGSYNMAISGLEIYGNANGSGWYF